MDKRCSRKFLSRATGDVLGVSPMTGRSYGWPVLPITGLFAAAALAGCIASNQGLEQATIVYELPALPSLSFAKNVLVDGTNRAPEPSIAIDSNGHMYVTAPSGMVSTLTHPGRTTLNRQSYIWESEDDGQAWRLLTLVNTPAGSLSYRSATVGGADTDVAVDKADNVYFVDLWLGDISISVSTDGGETWLRGGPVTSLYPVDDRQWIDTYGVGTVYLAFQTFYGQVFVIKSTDMGLTFPQQVLVTDDYSGIGNLVVDENNGNVYVVLGAADGKGINVAVSQDEGMTWDLRPVVQDRPGDVNNIFPVMDLDASGNLYVAWSEGPPSEGVERSEASERHDAEEVEGYHVLIATSADAGTTWNGPILVAHEGTSIFPWVAAGSSGRVAISWYGTDEVVQRTDHATGEWHAYVAQSLDALADEPIFETARTSDKPLHEGGLCTQGLGCTISEALGDKRSNRNLADFWEIAITPAGKIAGVWSDDTADGRTALATFALQDSGPGMIAALEEPAEAA